MDNLHAYMHLLDEAAKIDLPESNGSLLLDSESALQYQDGLIGRSSMQQSIITQSQSLYTSPSGLLLYGNPMLSQAGNYGSHHLFPPSTSVYSALPSVPDVPSLSNAGCIPSTAIHSNPVPPRYKPMEEEMSLRRSMRQRSTTAAGRQYRENQSILKFKNAVKYFRREATIANKEITGNPSVDELFNCRRKLEKCLNEVTDRFHDIDSKVLDFTSEFKETLDDCVDRNHSLSFQISLILNEFKGERSVRGSKSSSKESKLSTQSGKHSKSSGGSERSSSSKSIKAEAVAKAAELKAKLKFLEVETEQKAKLDRIQMLRDIEIAEAKVAALSTIDKDCVFTKSLEQNSQSLSKVEVCSDKVNVISHDEFVGNNKDDSFVVGGSQLPQTVSHKSILNCEAQEFVPVAQPIDKENKLITEQTDVRGHCAQVSKSADLSYPCCSSTIEHCQQNIEHVVKSLVECVNTSRLSVPEPGVFTGDPIQYPSWRVAFKTLIESRNIPLDERIHYLKDCLSGAAKTCVESFLLVPTAESYVEAMKLIDSRFGDKFSIAQAFKKNLDSWPKIANKDYSALREFSDFLRQCEVAARTNDSLQFLNDDSQNRNMCSKLPDWVVSRWMRVVYRSKELSGCFPPFIDFVSFLVRESDIVCDPVFLIKSDSSTLNKSDKKV